MVQVGSWSRVLFSTPHPGPLPVRGGEGEAFAWFAWFAVSFASPRLGDFALNRISVHPPCSRLSRQVSVNQRFPPSLAPARRERFCVPCVLLRQFLSRDWRGSRFTSSGFATFSPSDAEKECLAGADFISSSHQDGSHYTDCRSGNHFSQSQHH